MKRITLGCLFLLMVFQTHAQMISTKPPDTVRGIAVNLEFGAALWVDSMVYYIDGLAAWTGNSLGRYTVSTGDINFTPTKGMFLAGKDFEDGPVKGLKGVDPEDAPTPKDRRFIRNANWKVWY